MTTSPARRLVDGVYTSVSSNVRTIRGISARSDRGLTRPVSEITVPPALWAARATVSVCSVWPVFEIATVTLRGPDIVAAMNCWWKSSGAWQGTPKRGNFCWASCAMMPLAPKPMKRMSLASRIASMARSTAAGARVRRARSRLEIVWSKIFSATSPDESDEVMVECVTGSPSASVWASWILKSWKPSHPTELQKRITVGSLTSAASARPAIVYCAAPTGLSSTIAATRCSERRRCGS
ncbi:MAG: hypothetical protein K0R81_1642 [Microbacterium sp.]|nr:hypothetical protein [Microbacterium sp.]